MKISWIVNPVFTGWCPTDDRLGGTEESVVEWAKRLKKRGHDVEVFHNGEHGVYDKVPYRNRIEYPARAGDGITINVNYPDLDVYEPTLHLTNMTDAKNHNMNKFVGIILPSKYAFDNLGIKHEKFHILPHGFDSKRIYSGKKIPKQVLYSSSPDRGLANLVRQWPEVVKAHPDAQLIVTYNGQVDLPNTTCLGNVPEKMMDELYRTSDVWVHPCINGELFGMSAIKAQASGCVPVYYPTMALAETIRFGRRSNENRFTHDLIDVLGDERYKKRTRYNLSLEHFQDWEDTTDSLERILFSIK